VTAATEEGREEEVLLLFCDGDVDDERRDIDYRTYVVVYDFVGSVEGSSEQQQGQPRRRHDDEENTVVVVFDVEVAFV